MLTLATDALAAFRLSRLVVLDSLLETPRGAVIDRLLEGGPAARKLAEGLECTWCVGVWAATAVVALRRLAPRAGGTVVEVLAVAGAAGLVNEWGQR